MPIRRYCEIFQENVIYIRIICITKFTVSLVKHFRNLKERVSDISILLLKITFSGIVKEEHSHKIRLEIHLIIQE